MTPRRTVHCAWRQLTGGCIDEHVAGLLLKAMAPAAVEVSLAAAEQVRHSARRQTGSGSSA
jgi:hypothetical protein